MGTSCLALDSPLHTCNLARGGQCPRKLRGGAHDRKPDADGPTLPVTRRGSCTRPGPHGGQACDRYTVKRLHRVPSLSPRKKTPRKVI